MSAMTSEPAPATTPRPTLGRRFLTVWFGQTVSAIGSTMSGVGVAVWVYVETGSATWLGLLTALAAIPHFLMGPALPMVDRFPRRTVMIAADSVAALGTVVALGLALAGRLEIWHLALAAFIGGIGTALQVPAFQAAIPALVEPDAIGRANGLNQFGPAAGILIGPMLATPLVAWVGITAVLVVDLVTFLVAVVTTICVRFGDLAGERGESDDGSWRAAWGWLRADGRPLVVLLFAMSIANFCFAFFNIATFALATSVGGTARSGLVFTCGGVAMLVGSVVLGRRGVPDRRGRAITAATLVAALGCVVGALRPTLWVVILGAIVTLAAVPVLSACAATSFHERVPRSMQGRVFGLRTTIARALDPVGAAIAGVVIARVAEPTMTGDGVGALTIGRVIGTGAERGAALVAIAVGVAVAVLAVVQYRLIGDSIDRVHPEPDATDAADHSGTETVVRAAPVVSAA
jgi:DHA3 family macrolide efflux protein-like MFS transporter